MKHVQQLPSGDFYDACIANGITYFCGVPDSLVSAFSFYVEANAADRHTIAANEGNAIGLAIGYHVATGNLPLVYMQNSGLGNAIDPLVSLVDQSVFSIPALLLISWRGQPGIHDEPQHVKQGAVTTALLETLGIPYVVLSRDTDTARRQVDNAANEARTTNRPYAFLLEKDTFEEYSTTSTAPRNYPLSREEAIEHIVDSFDGTEAVIASIGKISRELFEFRDKKGQSHDQDLLIVGGMGHASSIALGVALQKPEKKVVCIDGDGSVLMHMGSLATIGASQVNNFYHIVLNNGVHDSVGGQPTVGLDVDLPAVAKACGYNTVLTADQPNEVTTYLKELPHHKGPVMLEIRIRSGARSNLSRPSIHPTHNKESFMAFLDES